MTNKDYITIFDALAVKHWTDSTLTGFLKTNAMAATLQTTNAKFAGIQGIDIRAQRRGIFLYSRERSMLLDNFNAPHLLWVDITRRHRVPTRHREKVEFTLYKKDIQWNQEENNETGGRRSQDEAADGENEGHGADTNSDGDQNAQDSHNSKDAHEVRSAYESVPYQEEILSLADGSSLRGARKHRNHEG